MSLAELPELRYAGEQTPLYVEFLIKLGTLRQERPDRPQFHSGDRFLMRFENGDARVGIVLRSELAALRDFTPGALMLDGYRTSDEAAQDLASWYPGTTPDTQMRYIIAMPEEAFARLPEGVQSRLLTTPINEAVKDRMLRTVFFPSMIQFMVGRGGGIADWTDFLLQNDLADQEEIDRLYAWIRNQQIYDMGYLQRILDGHYGGRDTKRYWAAVLLATPQDMVE